MGARKRALATTACTGTSGGRQAGSTTVSRPCATNGANDTPAARLSLATYVDAVSRALPASGQALLVGHSMAGMVISQVAENMPERVAKLARVAADLPRDGESLYQLSMQDKGSQVGRDWRQDNPQAYSPATMAKKGLVATFCADCSPADQQWLLAKHKAEAVPPLGTPVRLSAERFGRVPRACVHTSQDLTVSLGLQQAMPAAAGGAAPVTTLHTSHMPMLTQPKALADAILASLP